MYKNFTEYWEQKKDVLEKLGVSKEAAKMIFLDAIDLMEVSLKMRLLADGIKG